MRARYELDAPLLVYWLVPGVHLQVRNQVGGIVDDRQVSPQGGEFVVRRRL
jgi:hypothetical protein